MAAAPFAPPPHELREPTQIRDHAGEAPEKGRFDRLQAL